VAALERRLQQKRGRGGGQRERGQSVLERENHTPPRPLPLFTERERGERG